MNMKWGFARKPNESDPDTVQLSLCDERLAEVSKVLQRYLPEAEYERCWRRWRPVLEQQQLFDGTPFKNIVQFVKSVAQEHGLSHKREKKLRSALFALSFNSGYEQNAPAKKTIKVHPDQINRVRFSGPGMDKFENATMVVTSPRTMVLMTKRGLLERAPVKILLQNETDKENTHSALLFQGSVRKISSKMLGSRYKYVIKVKNPELKMAAS